MMSADALEHWIYVYYRVAQAQLPHACEQASALFGALAADLAAVQPDCAAMRPRLLRRPELRDGEVTLMEVYGPMRLAALQTLQGALSAHLQPAAPAAPDSASSSSVPTATRYPLLASLPRHTEHFIALDGQHAPVPDGTQTPPPSERSACA